MYLIFWAEFTENSNFEVILMRNGQIVSKSAAEHELYFKDDVLFSKKNLKKTLLSLRGRLTDGEINQAISFHNGATGDGHMYGIYLYWHLLKLQKKGKLEKKEVQSLYI